MSATRRIRTVAAATLVVSAAVAAFVIRPSGAQEGPASGTATVDKVGWWNRAVGPVEGEPANDVRPLLAPVPPAPTNTPANAIGVAAVGGEPTKVAAVGLVLEAPPRATADRLTLTLKESADPGATVGGAGARIVACPITGFWGDARNAAWQDRPEVNCDAALAEGARADDGTWTFDLRSMGTLWLDPDSGVAQNGVLLLEGVDAPEGFDVSFLDPASGGITVQFSSSGGDAEAEDAFGPPAEDAVPSVIEDFGTGTTDVDLGRDDVGGAIPETAPAIDVAPSGGDVGGAPGAPAVGRVAGRVGDTLGNLSGPTWLLLPLALLVAAVLSLTLGSDQPPGGRRSGGVSRALARREAEREAARAPTSPWANLQEST